MVEHSHEKGILPEWNKKGMLSKLEQKNLREIYLKESIDSKVMF